jgi:hypothetical protein
VDVRDSSNPNYPPAHPSESTHPGPSIQPGRPNQATATSNPRASGGHARVDRQMSKADDDAHRKQARTADSGQKHGFPAGKAGRSQGGNIPLGPGGFSGFAPRATPPPAGTPTGASPRVCGADNTDRRPNRPGGTPTLGDRTGHEAHAAPGLTSLGELTCAALTPSHRITWFGRGPCLPGC